MLLTTFYFMIIPLIAIILSVIIKLSGDKGANVQNVILNAVLIGGVMFGVAYALVYWLLPSVTIGNIVMIGLVLSVAIFFGYGARTGNKTGGKLYAGSGIAFVLGVIWIITTVIVGANTNVAISKGLKVDENEDTRTAFMPEVNQKDKTIPVVNNVKTVLTQLENSVSNIENANVYDVGHARVQLIKGKMVYITPLDFTKGYFKYKHYNKIDGYFQVDASAKEAKPQFIKKDMEYTPNAYFGKDAYRRMYSVFSSKGYVSMTRSPQLEVDDDGNPYYVLTVGKTAGITGKLDYSRLGVVVLNAENGETKLYDNLSDKPKWLDVAVNPTVASQMVNDWGRYRGGWINQSFFGGKSGVLNTVEDVGTEGANDDIIPVYYNGKLYYSMTLTSENRNQTSAFGYAYVDASTGKVHYYREKETAMTPDRAIKLSESLMKQTKWKGSSPTLYRIDGKPTWVVSMLDDSHAFRGYVYVLANGNGVSDTLATGTNADNTLENYRNLAGLTTTKPSEKVKPVKRTGTISRFAVTDKTVMFLLQGDKTVYTVNLGSNPLARFVQIGDNVTFNAKITDGNGEVLDFVNSSVK